MTIEQLRNFFHEKGYYGTTTEFQTVVIELFNKIETLEKEVQNLKYTQNTLIIMNKESR